MNVVISDEAHDGWREFAAVHGANVTALVEASGLAFARILDDPEEKLPPMLRNTVQEARRIAAKRSARRHRP
jgi:hypothetical protein